MRAALLEPEDSQAIAERFWGGCKYAKREMKKVRYNNGYL